MCIHLKSVWVGKLKKKKNCQPQDKKSNYLSIFFFAVNDKPAEHTNFTKMIAMAMKAKNEDLDLGPLPRLSRDHISDVVSCILFCCSIKLVALFTHNIV